MPIPTTSPAEFRRLLATSIGYPTRRRQVLTGLVGPCLASSSSRMERADWPGSAHNKRRSASRRSFVAISMHSNPKLLLSSSSNSDWFSTSSRIELGDRPGLSAHGKA
ncbi:hypothetical protein PGT21_005671 [Puccinia graminis f. sp. tritici]|uniref:Uncharacterized protein n=1 Tax=Puccinia graminis f. sp. tritici TaxID=56615 RepID=A0A5B0PR56_PUCGR|nr:hypothetical protein PGT21_005671 [Puccinia graminis f. sp. tritici]